MNTAKLRSKRVIISTVAVVAALGIGGGVWATAAGADPGVPGAERDRVAAAAVQAAGGGTAAEVETSDDRGAAYEVEVRKPDGAEVDVTLDKNLKAIGQEAGDADDAGDTPDRVLTAAERTSAEQAARAAVSGGTVLSVEAGDQGEAAYEAEVRGADGMEWDVELDAAFKVLGKTADN
jgi:uncharacterized membrane protein YkoI